MIDARSQNDLIAEHFRRSCETLSRAAEDPQLRSVICSIAGAITAAFRAGRKLLIAGNGGSAADAQHIAAEFLSRLNFDRNPLPAIALTTDSSVLTAIGNDYEFAEVFARQLRGIGRKGDALLALSTSGTSENVVRALRTAKEMGIATIGLTGQSGGKFRDLADIAICVPATQANHIQEMHIAIGHYICGFIEQSAG